MKTFEFVLFASLFLGCGKLSAQPMLPCGHHMPAGAQFFGWRLGRFRRSLHPGDTQQLCLAAQIARELHQLSDSVTWSSKGK